jgi:peptide/nickel transport system substrate-binding protein
MEASPAVRIAGLEVDMTVVTHVRLAITLAAAFALAAGSGVAAASASTVDSTAPGSGSSSVLRIAADTSFSTFNPFTAYFQADLNVIKVIYPTLTQTGENGQLMAYLATSWSVSPDHLTWTFKIRAGLKWTDGVPITAQDVAWTYHLVMTNQAAATSGGALVGNFASVSAPDASTFVIKTKRPQDNIPYASLPVVPEHIWKNDVKDIGTFKNMTFPVVGYGPWIATGYVPNQYATLTANEHYYRGAPGFKTLIIQYFTSSDAAVAALRNGELDSIDDLTPTQYEALKGARDIALYPSESSTWNAIELNPGARTQRGQHFGNGNPALADPVVRDAIALAINRNVLVDKVADGLAVPGAGFLTPAFPQWWWTPPANERYGYDPARANQMLTAAGFKMGRGGVRIDPKTRQPLDVRLGIHSDNGYDALIAPYLVEWLQAIGIKLSVQAMSFTELNAELPKGDWDILMDTWSTGYDPSYLLSIETCGALPVNRSTPGNTDAFYCDPAYDKLYHQQLTEFSLTRRARTIDQMQEILYHANVDIILYFPDRLQAVRTDHARDLFYGTKNGPGFYPQQNVWINWWAAKPVPDATSPSGNGLHMGVLAAVVVVLAVGGLLVTWRRATAGQRE